MASSMMRAARSFGKPKMPVEMAGKATEARLSWSASSNVPVDGHMQLLVFHPFTPDRTDGMDHITARQLAGAGVGRLLMRHRTMEAHPGIALSLDLRPAAAGDGACHTAAVLQVSIGGVDDGVYMLFGQVALHQLEDPAG